MALPPRTVEMSSRWQAPALKKLVHLSDVVDVVRHMQRPAAAEQSGASPVAPVSEPPSASRRSRSTELPLDLSDAPRRPAASAPGRLSLGDSGGVSASRLAMERHDYAHDFERETCWAGSLRAVDASEAGLRKIFEKRCGVIRSTVVRQKPDSRAPDGSPVGKSWALVTFLRTDGKERAVSAADGSILGTGGYPVKVEILCLDDAFNSEGELPLVWKHAKDKAKETTSWDRTHPKPTLLASPRSKRQRRHSTPGALANGGAEAAGTSTGEMEMEMARALRESGKIDDISEVAKEAFLAKGTSGAVFRAQWNGMKVAAKYFTMMEDPKVMEAFRQELEVMQSLQHTNLLRVYGYCMDPSSPCLVTELMHGSLDQLLWGSQASTATTLRERQQLRILDGIASGIAFLHKNRVCHRDLKSPNCLYNRDLTVKLCDFAFSKWKSAGAEQVMSSAVGTPAWMAPEILRGGEYNFKVRTTV
jgi:tRNA A-37 threonylcarbamoyl transferase component Bud32